MNNKFLTLALLGLIIAFGVYIYKYPPTKNGCNETPTGELKPITMPKVLVQNMINNYRNNQLVSIGNASTNAVQNDATSTWIDLESLKTFIKTIEYKASKDCKDLGIRFYYAAYPDANNFGQDGVYKPLASLNDNEFTKQYGKKHTLILIPTTKVGDINKDFNPELKVNEQNPNNGNMKIMSTTTSSSVVMAKNHTELCPPYPMSGQDY